MKHPLSAVRYLLVATASLLAPAYLAAAESDVLARGPYLQQASANSVVIVWRTRGANAPELRFGESPGALSRRLSRDAILTRASADLAAAAGLPALYQHPQAATLAEDPSTPSGTFQFEATITELNPNSKYYYAIYDGETKLAGGDEAHHFVTHPPIGSVADMRIWVVGDSGTGKAEQAAVHDAMIDFTRATGRRIDHYIHVGDMAYGDGTDPEFQDNFFAPYQTTLRNTVCWPTMGNHEGHTSRGISGIGPYYDAYVVPTRAELGGEPSGTEAYYSFDIADAHFICLDSHDLDRSPDAAMAQWLRADLDRAKAKWLIAFWHHPPYTKGSHDSDRELQLIEMRQNFMPILESAGVDLTLTGHSHIYERSMLIDGAYATPTVSTGVVLDDGDGNPNGNGAYRKSAGLNPNEGSVSIVSGHGGAGLGRKGTMPVMREIILEHGSVILDLQGDTLTGIMLDKYGKTRDLFSIVKRGKVAPQRIENPWQPPSDPSLLTTLIFDARRPAEFSDAKWSIQPDGATASPLTIAKRDGADVFRGNGGMMAVYNSWILTALDLEAGLLLPDGANAGFDFLFAYEDEQNHAVARFQPVEDRIVVMQTSNGAESILAELPARIDQGTWLEIGLEFDGQTIELECETRSDASSVVELKVKPPSNLSPGKVGFALPVGGHADIRWIEIQNEGI